MLELGFFTIDFTPLLAAVSRSPLHALAYLFVHGGFIPIVYALGWGFFQMYMNNIQGKYVSKWQRVTLAIDIPRDNEKSPKAVELIFTQIAGAQSSPNFVERYFDGKVQEPFSFEIASHEGIVRYYIQTTAQFRDLVEASVFAQYPDAQITEVEDYTTGMPEDFPNEEWNLWGTEMELYGDQAYPIRTYPQFEHQLSGEFIDPMAALLEVMSKMGPGEHAWMQLVLVPINDAWKKDAAKLARKLAGIKEKPKPPSLADQALGLPTKVFEVVAPQLFGAAPAAPKKEEPPSLMQHLTPGESRAIEAIQYKAAKTGFLVKFRIIYVGKKPSFHKGRGVTSLVGAIKQFNTQDMNGFKPNKRMTTKIDYWRVKERVAARQRAIMRNYKLRSPFNGIFPHVLNVEELATLWHFPVISVRAPMVAKTESKRREPPASLPTDSAFRLRPVAPPPTTSGGVPASLPVEETPVPGMMPASEGLGAIDHTDGGPPSNLPIG